MGFRDATVVVGPGLQPREWPEGAEIFPGRRISMESPMRLRMEGVAAWLER